MEGITDVLNATVQNPRASNIRSKIEKDDFLRLLFTQLKYQDFESSVDYKELMGQLSMLAEIEQSLNLNERIEELAKSISRMNFFYASSSLGKSALVQGDVVSVSGGRVISNPAFVLEIPAREVVIRIKNAGGVVIRTMRLSDLRAGRHQIAWDSKDDAGRVVPDGEYFFEIEAYDSSGNRFSPQKAVVGKVDSVSIEGSSIVVEVGGVRFPFERIIELRNS